MHPHADTDLPNPTEVCFCCCKDSVIDVMGHIAIWRQLKGNECAQMKPVPGGHLQSMVDNGIFVRGHVRRCVVSHSCRYELG